VAANYLCVLETARLLLAAPHAANEDQRAQVSSSNVVDGGWGCSRLALLPNLRAGVRDAWPWYAS
jgi:hypothetical protein